ncbi:MAG: acetyl-CoA hydrolase/transferase C-terminal domain-containing protein [bacterium]
MLANMAVSERITTPEQAVRLIKSGDRVYVCGNAATPFILLESLVDRAEELEDVELLHVLQVGKDPLAELPSGDRIRHNSLFVGPGDREAVNTGRGDYIPIHLHEIPKLLANEDFSIDVALIHTSPPDEHGFLSLGVEVITSKTAVERADRVVAMVNPRMPRTLGDSFVHVSQVDAFVLHETDLPVLEPSPFTEVEDQIAKYIADLVPDGACLQMGIGGIPNAVLNRLKSKNDLGIHTEMMTSGMVELLEMGVVTGACKNIHRNKAVCTFAMGTEFLYDYIRNNPIFEFHPVEYTNDPEVIAQHDNMVAVNSALEIDLTGQVCADSIGRYIYSGFGGQVDFIRGAGHSKNGLPIIAMPSTAKRGEITRIVPTLKEGAGVVTSRADIDLVVTEFGARQMFGKNLRERAHALIEIAHPDFRDQLIDAARDRNLW